MRSSSVRRCSLAAFAATGASVSDHREQRRPSWGAWPWGARATTHCEEDVTAHKRAPASWQVLTDYAMDQAGEAAKGRGPRRGPAIEERYRRYAKWCAERRHTSVEYLTSAAQWRCEFGGPWVALEPNIVPYDLEPGLEHWNLWYNPSTTRGSAELALQVGDSVDVDLRRKKTGGSPSASDDRNESHDDREDDIRGSSSSSSSGCIHSVRREDEGAALDHRDAAHLHDSASRGESGGRPQPLQEDVYDVTLVKSGEVITVGRTGLRPSGYAVVLRHLRLFLPDLSDDEVLVFQNIPEFRSVPEIAHAHVFFRTGNTTTRAQLRKLRQEWRRRSPWAEASARKGSARRQRVWYSWL